MGIVLRQSFKATIFSYIGAVIGVLNIVLVSPYCLSPEVIGLNRMFCESAMFLVFFVQLAVPQTAIKFFPYFKKDSDNSNRGFFAFFLIIPIIGLIIFGIIYIILKPLIINYFITNSKIFTSYFYYIIPFTVILSYLNVVETFATCLYRIVIPKMIREIIIRILNILIIFLFYFKLLSLNQFIISLIGIYFTGFLLNLFYLRKFLRISFKINFKWIDKNLVKQIIYYTIFIILGGIGSAIAGKIDVFMISSKLGISQTGIFTIAFYMIAIIEIPSRALMQISAPIVSEAIKNNDIKNIESIYKKSSINQLIVGGGLFILLWININNIFRIMPHGNLYECGRYVILFLGISKLFDMITGINGLIMTNSKYYKYYYIFIIILAASAIFWNNVFIPIYGIMGSAMATMISVALYNILLLAFLKIKMKIHPFSYSNIKVLLLLILTITIDMLLYKFKNPYIDATIRSTFFIVLYSVLNIVFKTSEDINAFLKSITSENINLKIKKYIHGFKNK